MSDEASASSLGHVLTTSSRRSVHDEDRYRGRDGGQRHGGGGVIEL